ncbi:MAG: hypothetical protein R3B48_05740 [Kofleriaceae bacterium]
MSGDPRAPRAPRRSDFALELELDRLEATPAGDGDAPWPTWARRLVAEAAGRELTRPRALALLRAGAPAWVEQDPAVRAVRQRAPSWPAYHELCAARARAAQRHFGCAWASLMRWHHGAPAAALPPPRPVTSPPAGWTASEAPLPWRAAISAVPGLCADDIEVTFAESRARTSCHAGRVVVSLRDRRASARGWFQLLHELGHALGHALCPTLPPLPRAIDEAVAAWLARHLEEPGSLDLPSSAWAGAALQRAERARRVDLASYLARLEEEAPPAAPAAGAPSALPWALWHDGGAQPAYLHAEVLVDQWWRDGLRARALDRLARALAGARADAAALPAPLTIVVP